MNFNELREALVDEERVATDGFDLLKDISAFVSAGQDSEARELVLRALEAREHFNGSRPILNDLVRAVGLYPYLDTDLLDLRSAIALEYHKPEGLDEVAFHSVQARVYRELLSGRSVILSAPTSFGKSLIIDSLIASDRYSNIVVIVPTLALIDETRRRLSRFSAQFKIVTNLSQSPAERNVFVFTQERFVSYQQLPAAIDLFVVDEFYKLSLESDSERAAILNQAFYRLFKTGAQFYLLGPDIRNLPPPASLID